MISAHKAAVLAGLWMAAFAVAEEGPKVELKPLSIYGIQEFGQIRKGTILLKNTNTLTFRDEWMDHFGAFITQEALIEDRLRLQVGLGGIFQFPKDERKDPGFDGTQWKMFFIGPTVAKGTILFGDPENPAFTLGAGLFPIKYNPDAVNLGEYLFRSGAYPTFVFNGGYLAVGDNAAYLQGFHGGLAKGGLSLDLFLTTETRLPPLYDWSLSAMAGYKVLGGFLDIGAGVKFERLLQVKPSRTSREELGNSYFQAPDGQWYSGNTAFYRIQGQYWQQRVTDADPADTAAIARFQREADRNLALADSVNPDGGGAWLDPATGLPRGAQFYTTAGTIVMGRIALDPKRLFGGAGPLKPADLRLYAEVAVLGAKDYPVFYDTLTQRMPIMFGINLPTFGLLDLFAVQGEYFGWKYENSTYELGNSNHAIPYFPTGEYYSTESWNDRASKDDWSWSVILKRTFLSSFTISAQFAKDHYRPVPSNDWRYGPALEPGDLTHMLSDWYWMLQFGWGI